MLLVVLEEGVREAEHVDDALVGDPVVDGALLAAGSDEAAPAQTGEMVRDLRLRESEACDEVADGELPLSA